MGAMADEEHLSSQFDVVAPNRAVRIGSRTYPAVRTIEGGGDGFASIPHENGGLTSVRHSPTHEKPFITVSTHGTDFHSTPEEVHERLDRLSTITETPSTRERNQAEIHAMRAKPAHDGAYPHGNPANSQRRT